MKRNNRSKRTHLVQGVISLAALVLALSLSGCASSPEPELEPEPVTTQEETQEPTGEIEETTEPEEVAPAIPEHCFSTADGKIVDLSGNEIVSPLNEEQSANADAGKARDVVRPVTALAEDRILLLRQTSEYDEEWGTEYDEQSHLVLADSKGAMVADLDAVTNKYGSTAFQIEEVAPYYSDGRLAVCLRYTGEGDPDGCVAIVLDDNGKEVFSVGDSDKCTYFSEFERSASLFEYDHAYFNDIESIFDVNGKVIAQNLDHSVSGMAGSNFNYFRWDDPGSANINKAVWNNDGTKFEPSTLSTEQIAFSETDRSIEEVLGSDVVRLEGVEANPHGGSSRDVSGLYNVALGKWITPLTPDLGQTFGSPTNQIYVSGKSKTDVLNEAAASTASGETAPAEAGDGDYSCIMDSEGNVIFDMSMSGIQPYCQDGSSFRGQHVIDGYWLIECGATRSTSYLIYFDENNKYVGAHPTSLTALSLRDYGLRDN